MLKSWERERYLSFSCTSWQSNFQSQTSYLLLQLDGMTSWLRTVHGSTMPKLFQHSYINFNSLKAQKTMNDVLTISCNARKLQARRQIYKSKQNSKLKGKHYKVTWGPRNVPCLARPVPFCGYGFLPVPLTSLIVFVECVPCIPLKHEVKLIIIITTPIFKYNSMQERSLDEQQFHWRTIVVNRYNQQIQ